MKKFLLTAFACLCIAASGIFLASCIKDGMDDENLMYSYVAHSNDFNYGPFEKAIKDNGIGTISEIYDGNPPHEARGCISQSTSVGALLYLKYLIDELNKKGGSK